MSDIIKLCSFNIQVTFLKKKGETFAQIRRLLFRDAVGIIIFTTQADT